MKENNRNKISTAGFILMHFCLVAIVYVFYCHLRGISLLPTHENIVQWDTGWYNAIVKDGYFFNPDGMSSVAFFPGMPLVWKLLHLNPYTICIFNMLCISISMYLFTIRFRCGIRESLLFLSLPINFFFFTGYSESLFFLFSVLFMSYYDRKREAFAAPALMLASFTRSASNVFAPAVILTEFVRNRNIAIGFKKGGLYVIATLTGLAAALIYHYSQTGFLFGFYNTQKFWGHYFRMPDMPLRTYGNLSFLDSAAQLVALICIVWSGIIFFRRFPGKKIFSNAALFFSILYIAGVGVLVLFSQFGDLHSLGRYVFCTSFFAVFFISIRRMSLSVKPFAYSAIFLALLHLAPYGYHLSRLFLNLNFYI